MFIAMNRFQVHTDKADEFINIWQSRDTFLSEVPGFKSFQMLRGDSEDGITVFASHSVWNNRQAFEDWTHSEAFRKAHAGAGQHAKDIYAGPPKLELFEAAF